MELLQILTSRFVIPAALEGNPRVQSTQMQNLKVRVFREVGVDLTFRPAWEIDMVWRGIRKKLDEAKSGQIGKTDLTGFCQTCMGALDFSDGNLAK
eukprot:1151484-Pelagomonas_calceolata.AAC.14